MSVKPTIVFDMDDTVCDWLGDVLVVIEQKTGRKLEPSVFHGGLWLEDVLSKAECEVVFPAIFNQQFYLELRPTALAHAMASSVEAKYLRQVYNFHVTTARVKVLSRIALRVTEMWLHSHNVNVHGISVTAPEDSKVQASPASSFMFIDDSKKVALDALDNDMKVVLIDSVWNQTMEEESNMVRLKPEEVMQYLADTLLPKSMAG